MRKVSVADILADDAIGRRVLDNQPAIGFSHDGRSATAREKAPAEDGALLG